MRRMLHMSCLLRFLCRYMASAAHSHCCTAGAGRWNEEVSAASEELKRTRKAVVEVQASLATMVGGVAATCNACCRRSGMLLPNTVCLGMLAECHSGGLHTVFWTAELAPAKCRKRRRQ